MSVPHEPALDSSKDLFADPYRFILQRCRLYGKDAFEARLFLKPVICVSGPEMAALFYDSSRFMREAAAPEALSATLFGKRGVHQLDGDVHKVRKAMHLSLMGPERIDQLKQRFIAELEREAVSWAAEGQVALYDALHRILMRVVCDWSGVPLAQDELPLRTEQVVALFDLAANGLKDHLHARRSRRCVESWLAEVIQQVRAGTIQAPEHSALSAVASHVDADGAHLNERVAAVELLNVLRPTVAVSVFIVFVAHALQMYPAVRETLAAGDAQYEINFVEEVRRFYPFFPAVAARVREEFEWREIKFPEGRRVLLDLYGTNRDPRIWDQPDTFDPERFKTTPITPFNFIPQGGADAATNHRCPGEAIAIALMRAAARFFTDRLEYGLATESVQLNMSRLPPIPANRFVIERVSFS